jgi:2-polyprenyl-3-methyl-5-hydroxy-6-metoxy-1,4-benzoquinol methylase
MRRRRPELMDQPGLDAGEHARALDGLRRINLVSRTAPALWPSLAKLARERPRAAGPLRVLDVATGGGDVPVALASRAERSGLAITVDGCDVSAKAVAVAGEKAARRGGRGRFFALDVLAEPIPDGYDVLICSLFLHHLDEADACSLLRKMAAAARRLVLVDDLARSAAGSCLAWLACHILSRSPTVWHDGPASAAAAFTPDEALDLARRAGLQGATIRRRWPCRFLLSWSRP